MVTFHCLLYLRGIYVKSLSIKDGDKEKSELLKKLRGINKSE